MMAFLVIYLKGFVVAIVIVVASIDLAITIT
jgi:hypothetical protein